MSKTARALLITAVLASATPALALAQTIAGDVKLIGADADALGKAFAFGDLNGDGQPDLFVSGCGP